MSTIDQYLRTVARAQPNTPFWIIEKDYALSYLLHGMAQVQDLHASLILKGGYRATEILFS
jgi:predicted nucleotidyltransferase component of viral defense system